MACRGGAFNLRATLSAEQSRRARLSPASAVVLFPNVPLVVGRSTSSWLGNLHISRSQAVFLWRITPTGESVVHMVNVRVPCNRPTCAVAMPWRRDGPACPASALSCRDRVFNLVAWCGRLQKGKNPSRVLSIVRQKQARIQSLFYCRLVPGDIVELLFDHAARFAFRVCDPSDYCIDALARAMPCELLLDRIPHRCGSCVLHCLCNGCP